MRTEQLKKDAQAHLIKSLFEQPIMDNTMRGIWVEHLVAITLGDECTLDSGGWNLWDILIGSREHHFPNRIRLQLKNSARRQVWHRHEDNPSSLSWKLTARPQPKDYSRYMNFAPCENFGFMCDAFLLCGHDEVDFKKADQREPDQWWCYIVPASVDHLLHSVASTRYAESNKKVEFTVSENALKKGFQGYPQFQRIPLADLNVSRIRSELTKAEYFTPKSRA